MYVMGPEMGPPRDFTDARSSRPGEGLYMSALCASSSDVLALLRSARPVRVCRSAAQPSLYKPP